LLKSLKHHPEISVSKHHTSIRPPSKLTMAQDEFDIYGDDEGRIYNQATNNEVG